MGLSSSLHDFDSQQKFLIGTLSHLPLPEQHFFRLSSLVLSHSKHAQNKYALKCSNVRSSWTSEHCMSVVRSTAFEENVSTPTTLRYSIDTNHSDMQGLFSVLPLEKPLYATQTFVQWNVGRGFSSPFSACKSSRNVLYLQPVDSFPDFVMDFRIKLEHYPELNFLSFLQLFTSIFFHGMDIQVLCPVDSEASRWKITSRHHTKTGRKQYLVGDFYRHLQRVMPREGMGIMGIVWTDLYPCEDMNFVLGEVSAQHKAGIFSFGRCEPKSFDAETFTDISEIDAKLIWRLIKVLSHELCHVLGFSHCDYFHCAMNGSSSLQEAFSQPLLLCPVCLRKLQHACRFSLLERYRLLYTFLVDLQRVFPLTELERAVHSLHNIISFLQRASEASRI